MTDLIYCTGERSCDATVHIDGCFAQRHPNAWDDAEEWEPQRIPLSEIPMVNRPAPASVDSWPHAPARTGWQRFRSKATAEALDHGNGTVTIRFSSGATVTVPKVLFEKAWELA